jgi:hypothetical protein
MYRNHGSYFFFCPVTNKWVPLGRDIAAALAQYGQLIGRNWSGRTFGDVIDRYRTQVLPLKRSAQTRKDQARQLTRLKAAFGSMSPDDITAQHCYQYDPNEVLARRVLWTPTSSASACATTQRRNSISPPAIKILSIVSEISSIDASCCAASKRPTRLRAGEIIGRKGVRTGLLTYPPGMDPGGRSFVQETNRY